MYGKRDEMRASQNLNPWSLTLLDSKLVLYYTVCCNLPNTTCMRGQYSTEGVVLLWV